MHDCAQEMGIKDLIQHFIESVEESVDSTGNESGPDLPVCENTTIIIHYFMINKPEIQVLWRVLNKSPQITDQKRKT